MPLAPIVDRQRAEPAGLPAGRAVVGLSQRQDRAAVDAVGGVRVPVDRVDARPDVAPVHLREVELRTARSQKHRVGKGRVIVDVGERGQAEAVPVPDGGAQPVQVDLRRRVPALILGFGIDDQALGAGAGRARGGGGLANRVGAVHVLPGAHVQALGAQRRHEPAVELRPRPHAVGSLDDERPHPGGVRVRRDRRYPAPVGPAQVPDPHGPAVRRPRRGPGCRETDPEHERRGHQR